VCKGTWAVAHKAGGMQGRQQAWSAGRLRARVAAPLGKGNDAQGWRRHKAMGRRHAGPAGRRRARAQGRWGDDT
jgi:hypothetical protein